MILQKKFSSLRESVLIYSALKFQIFTVQDSPHCQTQHLAITCGFVEAP